MISFNVTPDFNYKLEYNPTERILVIDTNIFNNIIDNHHIWCSWVQKKIQFNWRTLYLKITNMSIEKAMGGLLDKNLKQIKSRCIRKI